MDFFEEHGFEKGSQEMKILMRVAKLVIDNSGIGSHPTTELIKIIMQQELQTVLDVYGEYMHDRDFRDAYQDYIFERIL
jgi:hypothetical protein